MLQPTGIGDEAGTPLSAQIAATKTLGWRHLEMRNVSVAGGPPGNIHDIPENSFFQLAETLDENGIKVCGFGSSIGNWASHITDPFDESLARAARVIPRMQRLGATLVRVMSYAVRQDAEGRDLPDQMAPERFRRLRELQKRFADAGLTMVHENCMNYGGMSIRRALETLENVPGLRWVFDTCNPVFNMDRDHPPQMQDPWAFYQAVKPAISHVHVKDGRYNPDKKDCDYTLPGDGDGQVRRILQDLIQNGYDGFVSIEPHTAVVFHHQPGAAAQDGESTARAQMDSYVASGRRLMELLAELDDSRSGTGSAAAPGVL